jgi:putative transposase
LNQHWFLSWADAREKTETWRIGYNERRPNGSLGWLTPAEFARQCSENGHLKEQLDAENSKSQSY